MSFTCRVLETAGTVAVAAAEIVSAKIEEAITDRGECVLAVTGGSTPVETYRRLTCLDVDWTRICLVQTDERMLVDSGVRSSAGIEEIFGLTTNGERGNRPNWFPIPDGPAEQIAALYDKQLSVVRPVGVPDIAILGVGIDGHTASIFPRDLDAQRPERAIATTCDGQARVSLSVPYLRAVPTRLILAMGPAKAAAVAAIRSAATPLSPAAVILGDDGYLLVDEPAAGTRS
ncbi:6-phosphogluconolactonase [Nocardia aurea]|uniref:6-phosphogluconolactonase n=1 Tax=Nocardia aurea TaxID=2144174 RepID=UPI0013003796|nr:6-phosphogluconolactonase [Nocardia aurea]